MKTYTFTNQGRVFVIQALSLTAALTEYRRQLQAAQ
jgi:hypothetical protein